MKTIRWHLVWSLAQRDLHRSLQGLRLLFVCIFLGVATLAAIGSLTDAITNELSERGRIILGGDVQVAMSQRRASTRELQAMRAAGDVSETVRMRAMARGPDDRTVLAELKGVDSGYPLYGALVVNGWPASAPQADQLFIARGLADRLEIRLGDKVRFGDADFSVAGIIDAEPDRVSEGFTLGPVAIVSTAGLQRTGLLQPGSLFTSKYRLRLPNSTSPQTVISRLKKDFPTSSWEFRDRDRAAPSATRFFERIGQFLSLIGLAALIIASIGVSNGVGAYLKRKGNTIATLKMLGATSGDITRIYLLQIGTVALLAIVAGLVAGTSIQASAVAMIGDRLPVQPGFRLHPMPLLTSAAYGILMALIAIPPPLGRARVHPVASLFREAVARRRGIGWRAILMAAAALATVVGLAAVAAREPLFTLSVLAAVGASVLLLAIVGVAASRIAQRLPRPRHPLVRLAINNLYRPGAQTVGVVIALGLALTLFVSIAAIQTSLTAEIDATVPKRAPNQFVLDVPSDRRRAFESIVRRQAPNAELNIVPALRGTITAFGNTRVADLAEPPPDAWFLRGERGVTYSATLPQGSELTTGRWWPADYRGPPLVSLDREAAEILSVGVGDTLTVTVLGREIEARIASLREIHWDTMGFNYILVFPPSVLEQAPHNLAATIDLDPRLEARVARAILSAFPSATIIDVDSTLR